MKTYTIKLELTADQLHSLLGYAEDELEYWKLLGSIEDINHWDKTRDKLAFELDMIEDFPFDKNLAKA